MAQSMKTGHTTRRYQFTRTGKIGNILADNPNFAIFEKDGIFDIYDRNGHAIQIDTNYGQMAIRTLGTNHIVSVEDGSYIVVRDI